MTIGDLLVKRRSLRVDQREVARRMGLYKETIVDLERGKLGLTNADALRLENVLEEIEQEQLRVGQEQIREEVSAVV